MGVYLVKFYEGKKVTRFRVPNCYNYAEAVQKADDDIEFAYCTGEHSHFSYRNIADEIDEDMAAGAVDGTKHYPDTIYDEVTVKYDGEE